MHEIRSRESALEATLRETIASFNTSSRREAIRTLLSLRATNPTRFALASIRVRPDPVSAKSVGSYYLAGLIGRSDGVIDLLMDIRVLTHEEAVSLAMNIVRVDSFLDAGLTRKMLAGFGDGCERCSYICSAPFAVYYRRDLGLFADHNLFDAPRQPSPLQVRSKAVLLLGQAAS